MSETPLDLDLVRAELAEEVRLQREDGVFDATREQELERAFLLFAPRQGHTGAITATLRGVDAAVFVDPLVPIASRNPVGKVAKKYIRKGVFFYIKWIADQVTQAFSTIAVALHLIEDELGRVNERLDLIAVTAAPIIEQEGRSTSSAWWVSHAQESLKSVHGRVLVSACGDGELVRHFLSSGNDAYGIDPRPGKIQKAELDGVDLRDDDLLSHLSNVASRRLAAVVLTGTTEGLFVTQRSLLLDRLEHALQLDGVVVIHAIHPDSMSGDDFPAELDFAGARPLRPKTWAHVLERRGFDVSIEVAPDGKDFLVRGVRRGVHQTS